MDTPPIHKPSLQVHTSSHVKPWETHVLVKVGPRPPLPEADLVNVLLQDFLDDFAEWNGVGTGKVGLGVVVAIQLSYVRTEDARALGGQGDVVLHTL